MNQESTGPFESIEDAHEFLTLLAQTVFETKLDIEADVQREVSANYPRRAEALVTRVQAFMSEAAEKRSPWPSSVAESGLNNRAGSGATCLWSGKMVTGGRSETRRFLTKYCISRPKV